MFDKKEYMKQWRKNHLEEIKQYNSNTKKYRHQWRLNNLERLREHDRQRYKNRREKMIKQHRQYEAIKRKTDSRFNLNQKIKRAIQHSLKGNKNGRGWERLVGYTLEDLFRRLKSTMPEDYDWQDFLKGKLHIDHIIPISVFNFTDSEHIDFKRCWALENLQLLPAKENLRKYNKLTNPFQPALQIKN